MYLESFKSAVLLCTFSTITFIQSVSQSQFCGALWGEKNEKFQFSDEPTVKQGTVIVVVIISNVASVLAVLAIVLTIVFVIW